MDDKISRLIGSRRGKLSQLTGMMRNIENFKLDGSNVDEVEEMLHGQFCKTFTEFEDINAAVVALLDEDEGQADQHNWYEPRSAPLRDFVENTENWCAAMKKKLTDKNNASVDKSAPKNPRRKLGQDDIRAEDSVSQAATGCRRSKKKSSVASSTTTGSSARMKEKTGQRESTFATSVQDTTMEATAKKSSPVKDVLTAFHKPCLFCQKNHALSVCNKIKELTNTERIDFLKSKGLCFRCFTFGHFSKYCKKRLKCQVCSQSHPDILHVKAEDNSASEKVEENITGTNVVSSAYVSCGTVMWKHWGWRRRMCACCSASQT